MAGVHSIVKAVQFLFWGATGLGSEKNDTYVTRKTESVCTMCVYILDSLCFDQ